MQPVAIDVESRSWPISVATAACVATIAHATVGSTWHPVVGALIGVLWIGSAAAFYYEYFLRRRLAYRKLRKRLEEVIASGSREEAAHASVDLGVLLVLRGAADPARAAFERAIHSGSAAVVPAAAFNLGLLHSQSGDLEAAIPAYRRAIRSGHPRFGPMSANNMGQALQLLGRREQARAAFQIAASSGDREQVEFANWALAALDSDGPAQPGSGGSVGPTAGRFSSRRRPGRRDT